MILLRHRQTGFLAALKVIRKKQIVEEKLITQLVRELKIHAFLSHPNIIDFYGNF
jgi:serine/threonine protein kinase